MIVVDNRNGHNWLNWVSGLWRSVWQENYHFVHGRYFGMAIHWYFHSLRSLFEKEHTASNEKKKQVVITQLINAHIPSISSHPQIPNTSFTNNIMVSSIVYAESRDHGRSATRSWRGSQINKGRPEISFNYQRTYDWYQSIVARLLISFTRELTYRPNRS